MAIESTPESEHCTHCGYVKPHCSTCGGDFDDVSLTACLCRERGKLPELIQHLIVRGDCTAALCQALQALAPSDLAYLTNCYFNMGPLLPRSPKGNKP